MVDVTSLERAVGTGGTGRRRAPGTDRRRVKSGGLHDRRKRRPASERRCAAGLTEEERLLRRYRRTRSREVRDRLLEHFLPLVKREARRVHRRRRGTMELEDLVSVGALALLDALRRYDPKRGVDFRSFAGYRIRGAMLDELRAFSPGRRSPRGPRVLLMPEAASERLGPPPGTALEELVDPNGRDSLDELELREMIDHLTTSLTARERDILNLYYGRGVSMREISQRLGLSVPRVSALHASILGRLHTRFQRWQKEVFS